MKYYIEVRESGGKETWREEYNHVDVRGKQSALHKGQCTIDYWNSTLRPGEKFRILIDANILT